MYLINEVFVSIQGEGPAMGLPCAFIRLSGCNLRCVFCDTPQASHRVEGKMLSKTQILDKLSEYSVNTVVLTGGEPLLNEDIFTLCETLRQKGYKIHIETAGTIFRDLPADLVVISPKLSNSIPTEEPWCSQHRKIIEDCTALWQWTKWRSGQVFYKYVVESLTDLEEVLAHIEVLKLPRDQVYLMPQAKNNAEIAQVAPQVAQWCVEHGLRYSDRLQVRLWDNHPGY